MAADQNEYEIFISYARLDNMPIPPDYPLGWVTALRDHILADQRHYSTVPLRIFFDTSEIKDMDDWRHRILGGLRSSKILLVCLSPNYFKSQPCGWEWNEYLKRQTHQLIGSDSIASVYFVEVPGSDEQDNAKRLAELMRHNYCDLRPWFPAGARAMQEEEVRHRLDALGLSLWERIERGRRARNVPGNVRRPNPFFVGRREELRRLHEQLGVGAIGAVTAVHGLGGQGKTELANHYANGRADSYHGGLWSLAAEGKKELLSLLGELAFVPAFGYTPSEEEKKDANRLGQTVLEELCKRCQGRRAEPRERPEESRAALIILDNVSEPELLSAAQLANLPRRANWLRIMATTRLGPERLAKSVKQLATVAVDSLNEEDALILIHDHQPDQRFPNAVEEAAAAGIVRELGGFTLTVEQAAVHFGLNAEHEPPSAFLKRLRKEGLPGVDDLPKNADVAAQMLHQQKQLGPILNSALEALGREVSAAMTTLQFAALLPPDTVPWPWLKELTARHHPELADRSAEWAKIKRRLEGMRLLTTGDAPEIARMHRLVAVHMLKDLDDEFADNFHSKKRKLDGPLAEELRDYAAKRRLAVCEEEALKGAWELDALVNILPHLLTRKCSTNLIDAMVRLFDKVLTYRGVRAADALIKPAHNELKGLVASDPDNVELQRDFSVSLGRLGVLAKTQGNLREAGQLFTESLRIRQRLADADPASTTKQLELSGSLDQMGDLAVAQGNLAEAAQFYLDSIRTMQPLVESDPSNAEWQGHLATSLGTLANLAVSQGTRCRCFCVLAVASHTRSRWPSVNSSWKIDIDRDGTGHLPLLDVSPVRKRSTGVIRLSFAKALG
jgi:tetratricopeptide (TPR) repeat protein